MTTIAHANNVFTKYAVTADGIPVANFGKVVDCYGFILEQSKAHDRIGAVPPRYAIRDNRTGEVIV